ncbi:17609_t:CDS:2 [Acaulospora colombiana]|uniref:17609_t:CDS:1 n=1 Tax=Acaulospora colombiana TaxID=27376 RepID=A0ACA9L8D0_9GLOM|nr:17609_t:CDS:2 [Acaulospora colombiana]
MAWYFSLFSNGNRSLMVMKTIDSIPLPPTPCIARDRISTSIDLATPLPVDPIKKIKMEKVIVDRRPKISESLPYRECEARMIKKKKEIVTLPSKLAKKQVSTKPRNSNTKSSFDITNGCCSAAIPLPLDSFSSVSCCGTGVAAELSVLRRSSLVDMAKFRCHLSQGSHNRGSFFTIRNEKAIKDPLRFHFTNTSISPYAIVNLNILNFCSRHICGDADTLGSGNFGSSNLSRKNWYPFGFHHSRSSRRISDGNGGNFTSACLSVIFESLFNPHSMKDAKLSGMTDDVGDTDTRVKLETLIKRNNELIVLFQESLVQETTVQENSELSILFRKSDREVDFSKTSEVHLKILSLYFEKYRRALGYNGSCNKVTLVPFATKPLT